MNKNLETYKISAEDKEIIRATKQSMENISWAMQGLNKIGVKMESGFKKIPEKILFIIEFVIWIPTESYFVLLHSVTVS